MVRDILIRMSLLRLTIPAGINSHQQLRVAGKGQRGVNGGPNGDLYVEIYVRPHKYFVRNGNDISISVPVSAVDATLGCEVEVPTVYGDVTMKIPAGTQTGTVMRLKGKGVRTCVVILMVIGMFGSMFLFLKKLSKKEKRPLHET